jgi:hypothetical protein
MPRWRRNSIFGVGPRVPLDREQRAQFRAKLLLQRRPGRLTLAAVQIGRIMLDMLGADGQLDPSVATLAIRTAVHPPTVTRALTRLKECGFLDWTRRMRRDSSTGWRSEQTSNAYVLRVPASDPQFAPEANTLTKQKEGRSGTAGWYSRSASGAGLDRLESRRHLPRLGGDRIAKLLESWGIP